MTVPLGDQKSVGRPQARRHGIDSKPRMLRVTRKAAAWRFDYRLGTRTQSGARVLAGRWRQSRSGLIGREEHKKESFLR
jgi:hypothetical protein